MKTLIKFLVGVTLLYGAWSLADRWQVRDRLLDVFLRQNYRLPSWMSFEQFLVALIVACALILTGVFVIVLIGYAAMRRAVAQARGQLVPLVTVLGGLGTLAGPIVGGAFFTILGMYVYYQALGASEASRVVPLCATYPLVAFVLAVVFLRETFTVEKMAGTVLVVGGVYLLSK